MKRPRIIPVLLLQNGGIVKTTQFKKPIYIGDPINAVRIFNDLKVDELILLDIDATNENRTISIDLVKEIGEEANMPFSIGGGIKDISTIQQIIQAGAERVVLNTVAFENPDFVRQAVATFGSSTISVCIDYKKNLLGKQQVYCKNGNKKTHLTPLEAAKMVQELGAGEVVLQSIDRDGTMNGFDLTTLQSVNQQLTIPLVALGGAGTTEDVSKLYQQVPINGIACGSLFVFQGEMRGVLIQYPSIGQYGF